MLPTNMKLLATFASTEAPRAVVLVRLLVGAVFLSEGIQKFLFPADVGAGRFAQIGLPSPEIFGPFVGSVEIVCGTLVLLGLFTRLSMGRPCCWPMAWGNAPAIAARPGSPPAAWPR